MQNGRGLVRPRRLGRRQDEYEDGPLVRLPNRFSDF